MANQIHLYLLSILLLVACSCHKEAPMGDVIEDGIVIEKAPYWKTKTSDNGFHTSTLRGSTTYNDGFLAIKKEGNEDYIVMMDAYTGEIKWKWRDLIGIDKDIFAKHIHTFEKYWIYHRGRRGYCIDLESGKTVWNIQRDDQANTYIHGSGDEYYFYNGGHLSDRKGSLNICNVWSPDVIKSIKLEYQNDTVLSTVNSYGRVSNSKKFSSEGKIYYSIISGEPVGSIHLYTNYLHLYNETDDKWEYQLKQMIQPNAVAGAPFPIAIDGDRVYNAVGKHIVCQDLWTGEVIWDRDMDKEKIGANMLSGGYRYINGYIYAMVETKGVICLNAETGYERWRAPKGVFGTSSKLVELNGILYFRNGGSGRLVALDAQTGEHLWNLKSPDEDCCNEGWKREINVLPAKDGKPALVLTSTYVSAVALEAIR